MLFINETFAVFKTALREASEGAIDEAIDNGFERLVNAMSTQGSLLLSMMSCTQAEKAFDEDIVERPIVTTRRGLSVATNESTVTFRLDSDMIRLDWGSLPGVIASLRSAFVPAPRNRTTPSEHVEAALEMASGFGEKEQFFTVDDAQDIVKHYGDFCSTCPDPELAGEIRHVGIIGPKKLYGYIEHNLLLQ